MSDDLNPKDDPEQLPALTPVAKPLVAYQAHAFSSFTHITERPEGKTVADMVKSLNFPADYDGFVHVWINDLPLDRADWETVVPTAGQMVYVRVIPQGGGGGKDILRVIAAIAIAVVAFYYAPVLMGFEAGTAGWAAASAAGFGSYLAVSAVAAGIAILGNMALNALIPPPKLELDFGNGLGSQRNQLTGSSNRYAPYAPIPRIFGKRRLYPLLAGRPYSETQGDNEYLRIALLVGWGPLRISDIRIGETPITSFADVQYEVREGWSNDAALTLYTNTITEAAYSIVLSPPVSGVTSDSQRTTETGVNEITVDVTAPAGLARFESSGLRSSIDVDVTVQYRAVGSSTWLTPTWSNPGDTGLDVNGRIRLSGADTSAIRRTGRFAVNTGQYEVRLTRTTAEYDITQHVQEVRWTTMRSIRPSYPVQQSNVALIALRMKATGQLNGVPQQINCVAESYLPVYSAGSWSFQITRNPAWAFADVLRRRGGETYLSDDRIDLATISTWAAACDATAPNASEPYWTFDGVVEGGTVFQVLRQIAASARANYTVRDGKHSVVRDIQQTVPIQHITPRNSFGYSGSKVFLDYPHALRVVFVNAAKNYEEDERIVYDDGYNAANATKFETLELFGCTSATQAYREGRYFIAAARLRPETHVVSMDIENLRCMIGDLVQFQHDVVSIGIAAARVLSVTGNVIVLDQAFDTVAGTSYALRVRLSNSDTVNVSLQSPGATTTATFTATSSVAGVAEGDLAMFGISTSVSAAMIVKKIEPGPDFTAKLHLVDAQAGVYTADTGTIPAFNSNITTTQPIENQRPTAPTILDARSDDAVALLLPDGTLQVRISVIVNPPASSLVRADYFDVQWRSVGASNWVEERFARGSPIFLFPVQENVSYQIRVRAVSEYGVAGDWSSTTTHTVSGKNNPPSNVANLAAVVGKGVVQITWTSATDGDYDSTELRYGSTWAAGTFLWRGAASTYAWPRPANGTYKVWAAHRDTSGNYSATPVSVDVTVTNAVDPERTILLTIYRRSPAGSTPALPSANATYDFGTNTLSGLNNSWQTTAPAGSDPLWVSTATTTGNVTDTITPAEWSAATILLQDGTAGLTTAVVELFQRTATNNAPSVATADSATYTFATGAISGQPSGWSNTVPSSGGGYLWVIRATAAAIGATDSIANSEWTAPALMAQDGAPGVTGNSTALVYIYQRAASSPALPSVTTTYTFSTGALASLNNGWSQTPPAGTNPLYVAVATASSNTGSDTIGSAEWSSPVILAQNGSNGSDGVSAATVYLFQRTATNSAPSLPSANVTYTFATSSATGVNNGWSLTLPTTGGSYRWMTTATAASSGASDTILPAEWAAAALIAEDGTPGLPGGNGYSSALVYIYQRATSAPSLPSLTTTYTFASASLTGLNNGWSTTIPAGTDPVYVAVASATSTGASDTIASNEWSSPVVLAQNGTNGSPGSDGLNSATVYLFQRTTGDTPSVPSANVTYTFSSGVASGVNNGWSQSMPTSGGAYRWMITATAAATGSSDVIGSGEWAAPALLAQDGANGGPGAPGANGTQAAVVYLYQWSSAQPSDPGGSSTFTWSAASHTGYTGGNGWSIAVPSNPGTPGVRLWVASKNISDSATASATTVSWASGFTVSAWTQNGNNGSPGSPGSPGANGVQSAQFSVYQWAATQPAGPSGTGYYTWSSGDFGAAPAGWSLTPGTSPSLGFTLWAATLSLTDSAANASTFYNWVNAGISARGYAGTNGAPGAPGAPGAAGASARVAYARIANNPTPVSGTVTESGDSLPSYGNSLAVWGLGVSWSATDPSPSSTNTLYVTDGIYNPVTNQTVWGTPYIASLKVGTLSAITVNTGNLTVNGTLTVATGGEVRSSNYVANTAGWSVRPDGSAEYYNIKARGDIEAQSLKANTVMVQTLNIANEAVIIPRFYETSAVYSASGIVLTYTFDMAVEGKVIIIWQGQTASARNYRFSIYLNTVPGSGTSPYFDFVGYGAGDYEFDFENNFYYFVGAGSGSFVYVAGTGPTPDIGNTRTGGAFEDAPTAVGYGTANAGTNTIRIYWQRDAGELNYQRLIILGAQR